MKELEYPFDGALIQRKKKTLRKSLIKEEKLKKNIAILGGSTTDEIKDMLELFLLNCDIFPQFYQSDFGQYWQDAVFGSRELDAFHPDVIYIHTSIRNINKFPELADSEKDIDQMLEEEYLHFASMWEKLYEKFKCPVIQNNFEYPSFRILGNQDAGNIHGRVNYILRLNTKIQNYAQAHAWFLINDINYQSADFGLSKWADPKAWYLYKYSLSVEAIPYLAFNVANIIKALFGKNKKALAIDLDNTLWGGIVGDDGAENLELGQETPIGQAYVEFQAYLKLLQREGILLNIISKNEPENAMAGLQHPQMVLKPEDFIAIKANWEPKSQNLLELAEELTLLPDSFVFVDDNPAEREIVRQQIPGAAVPEIGSVENYIHAIDRAGYFEVTTLSKDDLNRSSMYKENAAREKLQHSFTDYRDYLLSLNMKAEIESFKPVYMARIAQLTNKSNQFNLTTKRYTQEEIEAAAANPDCITLYGKLEDCFGDNGVVSVVIGEIKGDSLDIVLWIMSCRVLKRNMETAMMDALAKTAERKGIKTIFGYYYPTAKNGMVHNFYQTQGFELMSEDESGNTVWKLDLSGGYKKQNDIIEVNGGKELWKEK